jgi:hypothetical protein
VSQKGKKRPKKQNTAKNHGDVSHPPRDLMFKIPNPLPVRVEKNAKDDERYTEERDSRSAQLRTARHLNRITIGAGVVSFLGLGVLYGSLILTGKALKLTKQATDAAVSQAQTAQSEFESSQRPWVSVRVVQVGKLITRGNIMVIDPTVFEAKNSGHSVAENVSYHGYVVPSDKENGGECDGAAKAIKSAAVYPIGSVIFPGDEVKGSALAYDFGKVDEEFRTSSTPGSMALRLVVCLVYTSPVDKLPHYTRVVYWIFHKGTQNSNFTRESESYDIELAGDINGSTAN